jgi:hypothetical protein
LTVLSCPVIAGLDPAIHLAKKCFGDAMEARVNPRNHLERLLACVDDCPMTGSRI